MSPIAVEAGDQRVARELVAREAVFEPFGEHDAQRLARGIQHRGRLGVMVEPLLAPVVHQHAEIEIVRADHRAVAVDEIGRPDAGLDMAPSLHHLDDALVDRDRRGAGRAGEAFLQAGGRGIDLPGVDRDIHAAERGGGVGIEQHVVLAADVAQLRRAAAPWWSRCRHARPRARAACAA